MTYYDNGGVTLTDGELRGPGISVRVGAVASIVASEEPAEVLPGRIALVAAFFSGFGLLIMAFDHEGFSVLTWLSMVALGVGSVYFLRWYKPGSYYRLTLAVPGTLGYAVTFSDEWCCRWFHELLSALIAGRPIDLPADAATLPPHTVSLVPMVAK